MAADTKWRITYFSLTPSIWVSNERATLVKHDDYVKIQDGRRSNMADYVHI